MYQLPGTDRILEVASAPGTGQVTLGGAVAGFRTFSSVLAPGDSCAYFIEALDADGNPAGAWERGAGILQGGPSLQRFVVTESSAGGYGKLANFTGPVRIGVGLMTDMTGSYPDPGGRLSVSATAPVADGYGTTLSYVPYLNDLIHLWNGFGIEAVRFAPTTINLGGLTPNLGYDVWGQLAPGPSLALATNAWSSNTVRATGLTYVGGFPCNATAPTQRYLGSFCLSADGKLYDVPNVGLAVGTPADGSPGRRMLWNQYNRVPRALAMYDNGASWTYGPSGPWRVVRGAAIPGEGVEFFLGFAWGTNAEPVVAFSTVFAVVGPGGTYFSCIGPNGAGAPVPAVNTQLGSTGSGNVLATLTSNYANTPAAAGYNTLSVSEFAGAGTTTIFAASLNALIHM